MVVLALLEGLEVLAEAAALLMLHQARLRVREVRGILLVLHHHKEILAALAPQVLLLQAQTLEEVEAVALGRPQVATGVLAPNQMAVLVVMAFKARLMLLLMVPLDQGELLQQDTSQAAVEAREGLVLEEQAVLAAEVMVVLPHLTELLELQTQAAVAVEILLKAEALEGQAVPAS